MFKCLFMYTLWISSIIFLSDNIQSSELVFNSFAQNRELYTTKANVWPIKTDKFFTSNFMEDRPGRFHAGLDLRTFGSTLPLYAIEDGYVSRINISPWGYGRAIYIKGKSGKTYVYAHTDRFVTRIDLKVIEMQYTSKRYRVNFYPKKNELPIKKGKLIGYSGSTGIGPSHLHFEIRDGNNAPINPEVIGYTIDDTVKPVLKKIVFTPLTDSSLINGLSNIISFTVEELAGDTISFEGQVGVSVAAYDKKSNNKKNKLGVYQYLMTTNKDTLFYQQNNGFSYADNKYAYQDRNYSYPKVSGVRAKNLYRSTSNKAKFYKWAQKDAGVFYSTKNDSVTPVKISLYDILGNEEAINFNLKGENSAEYIPPYLSMLSKRFGRGYTDKPEIEFNINDSIKKEIKTKDIKFTFYHNTLRVVTSKKNSDVFVKNLKGTFKLQKDKKAFYLPYYQLEGGENEFYYVDSTVVGYEVSNIASQFFHKITPDTTYEIKLNSKQKLIIEKNSVKKRETYFLIKKKNINLGVDGYEVDKKFLSCIVIGRSKYMVKSIKGVYARKGKKSKSMQLYTKSGKRFRYQKGGIVDSLVYNHRFNTRYVLQRDVVAPVITKVKDGKSIHIEESGSGVTSDKHISTTFNGKYILNRYDPETKVTKVVFTTVKDKGILIYKVRDRVGNSSKLKVVIE